MKHHHKRITIRAIRSLDFEHPITVDNAVRSGFEKLNFQGVYAPLRLSRRMVSLYLLDPQVLHLAVPLYFRKSHHGAPHAIPGVTDM